MCETCCGVGMELDLRRCLGSMVVGSVMVGSSCFVLCRVSWVVAEVGWCGWSVMLGS